MKFKLKIEKVINIQPDVLEKKIETYLTNNFYRITERGLGYIIFTEDEFSNRKRSRSDFRTRIGNGKFIFGENIGDEIRVELIYFTSISDYIVIVMLVCAFGIYIKNIVMPIVFSIVLAIPILVKIPYLNEHVFKELLEC